MEMATLVKSKGPKEVNLAQYVQVSDDVIVYLNKEASQGGLNLDQIRALCCLAKCKGT